ncbi:unnamed protein product [Lepeophtheirus salmonis]|uniref:RNA-directed DNA polymerase n=1 Tax=Lepeophtheirus salmonis TaxID=72036 RepID=A0A817FCI9_LEPSM|nr:unnamed protein product [Lepeophtheirus salmonis]
MKVIARQKSWWPSIDEDISDYFAACRTCHVHTSSPSSQYVPFTPADAWERIHVYYAKVNSKNILVLMESGSKWIEAATMSSTFPELPLKQLFSRFRRLGISY